MTDPGILAVAALRTAVEGSSVVWRLDGALVDDASLARKIEASAKPVRCSIQGFAGDVVSISLRTLTEPGEASEYQLIVDAEERWLSSMIDAGPDGAKHNVKVYVRAGEYGETMTWATFVSWLRDVEIPTMKVFLDDENVPPGATIAIELRHRLVPEKGTAQ